MSWLQASVTVQRDTLRSAASIRLGGSAAPTGSRPLRIAVRIAAASRMCSGPGRVADRSRSVSQAKLACFPVMPLDRSRGLAASNVDITVNRLSTGSSTSYDRSIASVAGGPAAAPDRRDPQLECGPPPAPDLPGLVLRRPG